MKRKRVYLICGIIIYIVSFSFIRSSVTAGADIMNEAEYIPEGTIKNSIPLTETDEVKNNIECISEDGFKRSVPLGKAKEVKTDIYFSVGEFNLSSSTDKLSEGTYKFYKNKWKPIISYEENNKTGYLNIKVPNKKIDQNNDSLDNCIWNIALNKNVRNHLKMECKAGFGNIDLSGSNLQELDFTMLAGEINVNLRNTSVPDVEFKAIAGNAVIDLSGRWKNDLHAEIKCGLGEITLKIPSKVGVKLNIQGIIGDVHTPELNENENIYTNALFGKTKETLYINFNGGIGGVKVEVVE